MTKHDYTDYREILQSHFESRRHANPRYSLRAFSRDLRMSPASVSQVLHYKKGLSKEKATIIADRLGLDKNQSLSFVTMVMASDARSQRGRESAKGELAKITTQVGSPFDLDLDTFIAIADWYHFAMLELTKLKAFKANARWISRRLGIDEFTAKSAIDRLLRLGLLKKEKQKLIAVHPRSSVSSQVPSSAIRTFNQQIIEKAKLAIHDQNIEQRELATLTFSVNKKRIPELKNRLRALNQEFDEVVSSSRYSRESDEIYCLSMQLFQLTQEIKK